ncbi:hypothetical protein [Shewanella waksmanii]|uniref:hypothetical protein n=1 Tax=Shewanella waksmanii TaxID=213783 RepID=UPI003736D39F
MRQLIKLKQQEEKKLTQLGQQRHEAANRVAQNKQQSALLRDMLCQYQQSANSQLHPLLLQNNTQLQQSLRPMVQQVSKKQWLLEQEQQRIDDLWRQQLQRQQRLQWLHQQRLQQQRQMLNNLEQQQLDDLAQRVKPAD